jgi:transcription-repair coupling factor (superfamily II helicase)
MDQASIDPGRLMKMVAKNAKKGAQFTPQGILRLPLNATEPHDVLMEIRALFEQLALQTDVDAVARR